MVPNKDPLLP